MSRSQYIEFDGAISKSSSLSTSFARSTTAYNLDGSTSDPNQIRYTHNTLFAGLPTTGVQILSSGNTSPQSFGYDPSGQHIISIIQNGWWDVHFGADTPQEYYAGISTAGTHSFVATGVLGGASPSGCTLDVKGTRIFSGSSGVPAVILGHCTVNQYIDASGAYIPVRDGLIFTDSNTIGASEPFTVGWISPRVTGTFTGFGDNSSIGVWPISTTEFVCITNSKNQGVANGWHQVMTRFQYVSGEWRHSPILFGSGTLSGQVGLCGGMIKAGATDHRFVASIGNNKDTNILFYRRRNGNGWAHASNLWTDSGIGGQYTVSLPDTAVGLWSTLTRVWGGVNNASGLSSRHNQVQNMIPANSGLTSIYCGANGASGPIVNMAVSGSATAPIVLWNMIGLGQITSHVGDGVNTVSLQGDTDLGYWAKINGADWVEGSDLESRLLFSPSGNTLWGQVYSVRAPHTNSVCVTPNYIYVGSTNGLTQLRRPVIDATRPVILAGSAHNIMASSISVPTDNVSPGNTIQQVIVSGGLVTGVAPPPPCSPNNIFYVLCGESSGSIGDWSLVNDNTPFVDNFMVKAWLYHVPATSATGIYSKKNSASVYFGFTDASGTATLEAGRTIFDSGKWVPATFFVSSGNFEIGDPWQLVARLRADSSGVEESPQHFLLAWEGVYADSDMVQSHGISPQSSGSTESLTVAGFDPSSSWSMLVVGMVPEDQWDNREGGINASGTTNNHTKELFRVTRGDNYISVNANPYHRGISVVTPTTSGVAFNNTAYWLRHSPVVCLLTCNSGITNLWYSVGHNDIHNINISDATNIDTLSLGQSPILVHRVEYFTNHVGSGEVNTIFNNLSLENGLTQAFTINRYANKVTLYNQPNNVTTFAKSTHQQPSARMSAVNLGSTREPDNGNEKIEDREVISSGYSVVTNDFEYRFSSGVNYEVVSGSGDLSVKNTSVVFKSGRGDITKSR